MSDAAERHHWRVHQFYGLRPGPRLLVLGAVHGNEVAGTLGIQRIVAELDAGALRIARGCPPFVPVTNTGTSRTVTMTSIGTFPYGCVTHATAGEVGVVYVGP